MDPEHCTRLHQKSDADCHLKNIKVKIFLVKDTYKTTSSFFLFLNFKMVENFLLLTVNHPLLRHGVGITAVVDESGDVALL
jgi:hypothetical protein